MKIFNVENGVKKVYVQKNDLQELARSEDMALVNIHVPQSLLEKIAWDSDNDRLCDDNPEFIECTEPAEIKFLKSIDWIIDFKKYNRLSSEKLLDISFKTYETSNKEVHSKHLTSRGNHDSIEKSFNLDWIKRDIDKILYFREGQVEIPFPLVPDSDGFSYSGNADCEYQMRASLNPNIILFYRKDGQKLSDEEIQSLPSEFISFGISQAIANSKNYTRYFGLYDTDVYLTEDKQYLVTEIKNLKYYKDDDQWGIFDYVGSLLNLDEVTIPKEIVKAPIKKKEYTYKDTNKKNRK